jgi:hypothetical protein
VDDIDASVRRVLARTGLDRVIPMETREAAAVGSF